MPEPPRNAFQYAIVRVLPRIERGECLNVGVVLLCRPRRFLGARIALDEARLAGLRAGPRSGDHPAAPRRHRADRRRRPDGRADRPARAGRAVPLAGRAVEHDHPGVGRPLRAVRRPGGRARAPRGDAGRDGRPLAVSAARPSGPVPARRRRRRRGRPARRASPSASACSSVPVRLAVATSIRRSTSSACPFARASTARPSRSTSVRAARPPVSGRRTRKLRAPSRTARSVSRASARMASPTTFATRSLTPAGTVPAQLDEQDRGRPAVARMARRLVSEGGHPVGPGVELDRSADARFRRRRSRRGGATGPSRNASMCSAVRSSSRSS